jgi:diguanylate cyclase (GGDEF)-like protein
VGVWLKAIHRKSGESSNFRLTDGQYNLGRATKDDPLDKLPVPHDPTLSRRHLKLVVEGHEILVTGDQNRHPIYYQGEEFSEFRLQSGQSFSSGQTVFELSAEAPSVSQPTKTFNLTVQQIDQATGANSDAALDAILKIQPLLSRWYEPGRLFGMLLPILTPLVPGASSHQVFEVDGDALVRLAHNELRGHAPPTASRTLVNRAFLSDESVCFVWDKAIAASNAPTAVAGVSWALASPIRSSGRKFVLYSVGAEAWIPGDTLGAPAQLDRALIALVARMVGDHLEGRRAAELELEVASERERRLLAETMRNLTQDLTSTLEPAELVERLAVHLAKLVTFNEAYPLLRQGTDWVCREERLRLPADGFEPTDPIRTGPAPQSAVLQGEPLWIPLVVNGRAEGALLIIKTGAFGPAEMDLVNTFSSHASVALQNALLFQEITYQASHDALTRLFNRRHFFQEAEELSRQGPVAVIILDVDHFKSFNDTHGHAVGDLVLQTVAQACQRVAQNQAVLARYGGEEFVLATSQTEDAERLGEELRKVVESTQVATGSGDALSVTISLGVAVGTLKLETLLKAADEALYEAKEQGRNRLVSRPCLT